jgi:hypothetical protein
MTQAAFAIAWTAVSRRALARLIEHRSDIYRPRQP